MQQYQGPKDHQDDFRFIINYDFPRLYDHWILGKYAVKRRPRWSIMRNLLHWVE